MGRTEQGRTAIVLENDPRIMGKIKLAKSIVLSPFVERYRIRSAYARLPDRLIQPFAHAILSDDGKFLFVKNQKCASTSLAQLMYYYSNKTEYLDNIHLPGHNMLYGLHHILSLQTALQSDDVFKYTFVRHPESRILSAFLDKIIAKKSPYERHISTLRNRGYLDGGDISRNFDVFLDYVEDSLNENALLTDSHWRHQSINVGFFDIKYDLIGRVESFTKDVDVILRAMGLSRREGGIFNKSARNESQKGYDLSKSQKLRVSKIFAIDYDNFGYS